MLNKKEQRHCLSEQRQYHRQEPRVTLSGILQEVVIECEALDHVFLQHLRGALAALHVTMRVDTTYSGRYPFTFSGLNPFTQPMA